jgi:hypothetical protein
MSNLSPIHFHHEPSTFVRRRKALLGVTILGIGVWFGSTLFERASTPLEKSWGLKLENRFDQLPEAGTVLAKDYPWAGNVWEKESGGISNRWMATENKSAPLVTIAELKAMSEKERRRRIRDLSPAEKFDLLRGRMDFPLTREEEKRTRIESTPEIALLKGWSLSTTAVKDAFFLKPLSRLDFLSRGIASTLSSVSLKEPAATTKTVWLDSSLKVEIPFASSDVKALISYYVGVRAFSKADTRTHYREVGNDVRELSAEDFHLVLTNTLGRFKKPLTFSFWEDGKKHYEPIVKFESSFRLEVGKNGENQYLVTTDFWSVRPEMKRWLIEDKGSKTNGIENDSTLRHSQSTYRIQAGRSEWLDGVRPTSVARMTPVPLSLEFEKLGELYEPSAE